MTTKPVRYKYFTVLITSFLLFTYSVGFCQQEESVDKKQEIDQFFANHAAQKKNSIELPAVPDGVGLQSLDDDTKKAYFAALKEHYLYRQSGYQHRRKVFDWQLLSSKITFYLVIFLVLCGVYFSGVQFHKSLKEENLEKSTEVTQLSASAQGITISSPILGVIILIISLLFFYLYLIYVYPIEEIF